MSLRFASGATKKYFTSHSDDFQRSFTRSHFHRSGKGVFTKRDIQQYHSRHPDHGRVRFRVYLVNDSTHRCERSFEICVDLTDEAWWNDLTLLLRTKRITTTCGKSISTFSREDFVKHGCICYGHSAIPLRKCVIPLRFSSIHNYALEMWWETVVTQIYNRLALEIASSLKEGTLKSHILECKTEKILSGMLGNLLNDPTFKRYFGCANLASLLSFRRGKTLHRIDLESVIAYFMFHVGTPVKFVLHTVPHVIGHMVSSYNRLNINAGLHPQITDTQLFDIVYKLIDPLFIPLKLLSTHLRQKMASHVSQSPNHKNTLVNHYVKHVHPLFHEHTHEPPVEYTDPITKPLKEIVAPFHFEHLIYRTKFSTSITAHAPLTLHYKPYDLKADPVYSGSCIISSKSGLTQCICKREELTRILNNQDGQVYLAFPPKVVFEIGCKFISLLTPYIMDEEGEWVRCIEYYNATNNISYFHLQ